MLMLTTREKITMAKAGYHLIMAGRRLCGLPRRLQVERDGLAWQLDLAEAIDFTIWLRGRFEPATLALCERLVSPGAVVLDIGANVAPHANASTRPRDGKFNRAHYSSSVLWLRPR
jgi:hypothetical protein